MFYFQKEYTEDLKKKKSLKQLIYTLVILTIFSFSQLETWVLRGFFNDMSFLLFLLCGLWYI